MTPSSCCLAFNVNTMPDALGLVGGQVALHRPFWPLAKRSGGSPFEKLNATVPVLIGVPQSSTIVVSTGVGHRHR